MARSAAAIASLLLVVLQQQPTRVAAVRSQLDFPACAVNHAPQYFCCEYGDEKELFTRFNRPTGGAFESFYKDGWKLPRQVNFPIALYTPDAPVFQYDDANSVCRTQRIYDAATKSVRETLQCGPGATITTDFGGTVVTNASLPEDSQRSDVFWTSRTGLRNSNASFVVGATCNRLMLANGQVDLAAKALCVPPPAPINFQFTTYTETPLLTIYIVYGLLFAALLIWAPLRASLSVMLRTGAHNQHGAPSLSAAPVLVKPHKDNLHSGVRGALSNKEQQQQYNQNQNLRYADEGSAGLAVPMLTRRTTDAELRAATDAIEQTGYRDSFVGKCILAYLVALTLGLFPLTTLVVLDSNRHFEPALFDPVNVLIIVYIGLWLLTTLWFVLLVIYYDKLHNLFRVREPLYKCQYVKMFNPESSEIALTDRSGVSQFIAKLESLVLPNSRQGYEETLRVHTSEDDGHRYVEFQHLRYIYDELEGKFVPGSVPFPDTFAQILEQQHGLSSQEVARRKAVVGSNSIEVAMPSLAQSAAKEVFHFFYVYELMCYSVWVFIAYIKVAIVNCVIIVAVLTFNTLAKRRILASVLQMTRVHGGVAVKRDGVWQTIKVSQLVPGDLVRVVENWDLPCDLVLIKGTVVCDESSLTGESMPVQKFPVPTQSHELYDPEDLSGKKHTLFAGGRTLASSSASRLLEKHDDILAIVSSTGAHTVRGQLIQSILYPSRVRFKYEEHLKACIVFLLCYGLIAAFVAMRLLMANAGLNNTLFAFVFGMFVISAVLSPLIPVVTTVGQFNASQRLQSRGIFCLNASRVALCGKVRVFAFDKTGTITKEGLDFRGVVPVDTPQAPPQAHELQSNNSRHIRPAMAFASGGPHGMPSSSSRAVFQRECQDVTDPVLDLVLKYALATCHAVGYLDDELVGNEVEVKMFQATQWRLIEELVVDVDGHEHVRSIVESPDGAHALEIVKRFEFDHNRACMSVVVEDTQSRRRFVFCKGSYEKLEEICGDASRPEDYTPRAEGLAKDGCYVLGLGFKELPKTTISLDIGSVFPGAGGRSRPASSRDADTSLTGAADAMSRDEVESQLSLLGLLLFQNELKHDSADVLAKLKDGDIRVVMITGDNAMTGCYIARESGMVPPGARVILGEIMPVNESGARGLVWKDVDTGAIVSSREIHDMAELSSAHHDHAQHEMDRWELAVTGAAFSYLRKMGELSPLLFHIRIFSRMTPVEKADCVAEMMAAGAVTGMCGDGGNDCGALRVAHVGVALSDTEASVVSPFTSQRKSIVSVLDVCREGRCSLKTSFGNFKFLMMYGMIGCGLRFTQYANGLFLPHYAFMFSDGLVLVGLSYAITLAKPLRTLDKNRPTSSLVGATTMFSIFGQELIHSVFLYFGVGMLVDASWYCPFNPESVDLSKWWLLQDTHLGSSLFLITAAQYIATALSFGFGSKFHEPVHKNIVLVAYTAVLLGALLYLAVGGQNPISDTFRMASSTNVIGLPDIPMPQSFCWQLVVLIAGNSLAIVVYERFVVLGPVKRWVRRRFHRDQLQLRL